MTKLWTIFKVGILDAFEYRLHAVLWILVGILPAIFSVVIYYSLYLLIVTTSFWIIDIHALDALFENMVELGKIPLPVWQGLPRYFFSYIFPLIFIAAVPVQIFLKPFSLFS